MGDEPFTKLSVLPVVTKPLPAINALVTLKVLPLTKMVSTSAPAKIIFLLPPVKLMLLYLKAGVLVAVIVL